MKILRRSLEFFGTRNGMRLVAVLAGIIAWYAIRAATSNSTLVSDIPITVQPPPGWSLVSLSAPKANVAFLGTRDDMRYLNREFIKINIDARDHADPAPLTVKLGHANINAPGNVRIGLVRPATVTLRLDREITKQVPVKVDTQNLLPDGYELDKVVVTPATVELTGPARHLDHIETIRTIPIDLDGRIRSINKRRLALVPGSNLSGVEITPNAVTLDLVIAERSVTNRYEDLPIRPLLPTGRKIRADLDPEVATLSIKGRPSLMKRLAAEDVRLFVDAEDANDSKTGQVPIQAVLPNGATLVRITPAQTEVSLKD